MHTENVHVLTGGQYGSEGKGAVAGAMVQRYDYDLLIRVAGPNAGHTTVDRKGEPRALRQIPAAGVQDHDANLYIAAGSEIDPHVLADDIEVYDKAGAPIDGRLYIDPEATLLENRHVDAENTLDFGAAGSTRKGIGAARADRLMRKAMRAVDVKRTLAAMGAIVGQPPDANLAMIEGTQGYWLGSHAGMYPYCTSSDCRAVDFLAMAGVTWDSAVPFVVFRSYPIRIAGESGPLEDETSWEQIGVPPEFTTVTKKMRRVGNWEPGRVEAALVNNRIGRVRPMVAMTFMDYLADDVAGQLVAAVERFDGHSGTLTYIGNGPGEGFWL